MFQVLASIKPVIDNAKDVTINIEKIREFCRRFEESHINHWLNLSPFPIFSLKEDDKLNFLLVFNSISFCYWGNPKWSIEYHHEILDGSFGMIAGIGRALEEKLPILNMKWLSTITEHDFAFITRGKVQIPLFQERLNFLRQVGLAITEEYQALTGYD